MMRFTHLLRMALGIAGLISASVVANDDVPERVPAKLSTTVLHDVPPDSDDVKTLYEVFSWGKEATAEYLFYGEIDTNAVKDDGTGDLTKAHYAAAVQVSFEDDVRNAVIPEIADPTARASDLPAPMAQAMRESSAFSMHGKPRWQWVVDSSPRHVTFLYSSMPRPGFLLLRFYAVDDERVTEIWLQAKTDEMALAEVWSRFSALRSRYEKIPMRRFTGAIRE